MARSWQEAITSLSDRLSPDSSSSSPTSYQPLVDAENGSATTSTPPDAELGLGGQETEKLVDGRPGGCCGWWRCWTASGTKTRIFWFLMPSFVARRYGRGCPKGTDAIPEPGPTTYLNGLRGIASFIVALQHNTNEYFPNLHHGYKGVEPDNQFIQLPLIRDVIHGSFMVTLFFVISGFALAYGPLKRMHSGRAPEAVSSLGSSVFRRPIRLFLPMASALLFSDFMCHYLWFYHLGSENLIGAQDTLIGELDDFWIDIVPMLREGKGAPMMPQTWTIAAEYQGSLLVFLCCLAFARVAAPLRMALVLALFIWQWYLGEWALALFLAGMLLADFRHLRPRLPELGPRGRRAVTISSWSLLFFAAWTGGYPIYGKESLGFVVMSSIHTEKMPVERFWHSVAAIAALIAMENLPVVQRKFNARWVLYLGEISYALYLVHWLVGMNVLTKGSVLTLRHMGYQDLVAWGVMIPFIMGACIWVADIHWRLVDQKSVRFAHWLAQKIGI